MYITTGAFPRLNSAHLQEWLDSAVDRQIIDLNVWTIEDPVEVDELLNRNTESRWKHSADLVPGWAVAGVDPKSGERTYKGAQFKPDRAPIDPTTQKPRKYFSPSKISLSPLFLDTGKPDYWQKLLFDFTTPIILTEGAKKAGAICTAALPGISIPGVTTGGKLGRLRPELEQYCRYGRKVYLAFDRDVIQKKQVQQALHNLGRLIAANGATVYVLEWLNSEKGIDDYLAAGGELSRIMENAKTIEEWRAELEQNPTDLREIETCRLALRYKLVEEKLRGRLRWNNLKGEVELDGSTADPDELRLFLALTHNIDIPSEDCAQIVTYLARQQKFSPVADYLHQCGATYEPDSELLNSVAKTYLGAESELHATFIRKTLIAAVARALQPGCKVDSVCILAGAQGVGKSSFWQVLAGDWFDDSVGSVSDKDERLKLHQAWFVEWAELEAVFKRKDISAVKAFITTQRDQIRPPYGRSVKEFPRPSIIVGTTNFEEFLADPTGNRRFWVVPVLTDWIPLEQLGAERDRIWAAAFHAFVQGERWELPTELRQQSSEFAKDYQISDPWEEPLMKYLVGRDETSIEELLSDVLQIDLERQDKAAQMRVSNLLKINEWRSSRKVVQGRRRRIWHSPSFNRYGCPSCPEDSETQMAVKGQPWDNLRDNPPGQPMDNPHDQPLPNLRDNLDGQPDQLSKSGNSQTLPPCDFDHKPPKFLEKGCPCEVRIDGKWLPATFLQHWDSMKFSPLSRKLEACVRVQVGPKREVVPVDCIRRLSHAHE